MPVVRAGDDAGAAPPADKKRKVTATEKAAAKAAAKAPAAKAPAAKKAPAGKKVEEDVAPSSRGDASAMVTSLKYTADPILNKSGVGCEEAKKALVLYGGLSQTEKKEFIDKFKQKGKKDLTWTQTFDHSYTAVEDVKDVQTTGMFTAAQILKMNALENEHFANRAEKDKVVMAILRQACDDYQYKMVVNDHDIPMLTTYLYMHNDGFEKQTKNANNVNN